jgi:alpha-ketoglutarate-dependent taurine dioxygenase
MTNPIEYLTDVNQFSFEQGVFPCIIAKPSTLISADDACLWVEQNISQIEAALARSGTVLFRGFPISSAETFDAFSAAFAYSSFTYQESLSNAVRINRTERVFTANEAPKDTEIYLHHEMAQTPISPDKLFFFCLSAAEHGGATPICRSDQLYAALQSSDPELAQQFVDKALKYTTHMPAQDDQASGQGRSWKSTLSVETKQQAESKLRALGYSWSWQADAGLRATTPVLPAVRTLNDGTQVFYNQLVAAYMGWEGDRQNPSRAITFGDGSAIPVEGLKSIVGLSADYTYDIQWQDGDVALIDNKMTMHGRRPYSGDRKREVLVALAV